MNSEKKKSCMSLEEVRKVHEYHPALCFHLNGVNKIWGLAVKGQWEGCCGWILKSQRSTMKETPVKCITSLFFCFTLLLTLHLVYALITPYVICVHAYMYICIKRTSHTMLEKICLHKFILATTWRLSLMLISWKRANKINWMATVVILISKDSWLIHNSNSCTE